MRFKKQDKSSNETLSYIEKHLDEDVTNLIHGKELDMAGKPVSEFDEEKVFALIITKIHRKERSFIKPLMRWVAVIITLFALGSVTYYISQNDTPVLNEIYAAKGEKLVVILADGSRVNLNSDSKLIYPDRFSGQSRKVKLIGEGYFSIKKDSDHPFIVDTYNMMVKVIGTKFNIKAYPEDANIITTLDKGKVLVGKNERNARLQGLLPGESAIYNKLTANCNIIKATNSNDASSWKNNKLIVHNETLRSIIKMIERNYNVSISVSNLKAYQYTYNINCDADNIHDVIEIMETITPIHFKETGNRSYELY